MSNRLGKVSREHLANKSLVLYFEAKCDTRGEREEVMRTLQQAYKTFGCEDGGGHFEVIYLTAAKTQVSPLASAPQTARSASVPADCIS